MANPFVDATATYERTIKDPRDGEEWQVTYRPLTAGDRAQLQDLARMTVAAAGEEDANQAVMRLGAAQIITLQKAIVRWTLPLSPTRDTIAALHPEVFDALFQHISFGEVPEEPPAGEDPTQPSIESEPEQPAEPADESS